MKNIFKKAILPLLVFGIAIAGVFATNSSTMVVEQPSQPLYTGAFYHQGSDEYDCIEVPVTATNMNCTLENTSLACTWITSDHIFASKLNPVTDEWECVIPLYKRTM